jgi:Zn-dependent protease
VTFLVVIIGWVFSLCLHEFSHALLAYMGGDTTVRDKGYLTFNPLKYTHPVFSILLPLVFLLMGGIGLPGGAVYIEKWRLRSRNWVSAVSLVGPLSNLLLAVILGLVLRFAPFTTSGIWPGIAFLALLQVMALVLNLIPLPPFDGYGVIEPFLSESVRMRMDRMRSYMMLIVFFVLWYIPVVNNIFWGIIVVIVHFLGVPVDLIDLGQKQFLFWR